MNFDKEELTMPACKHNMTVQEMASRGGITRAKNMTAKQRKAQASKAAKVRWKGHKKKK